MILVADMDGERLDAFLARSAENLSRSGAQKLIEEGCVLLDGKPGKKNDRLAVGQKISLTVPEPKETDIQPRQMPLHIVYEDEDLVLVNKQPNLVVHPGFGNFNGTFEADNPFPFTGHVDVFLVFQQHTQIGNRKFCQICEGELGMRLHNLLNNGALPVGNAVLMGKRYHFFALCFHFVADVLAYYIGLGQHIVDQFGKL